MQSESSKQRAVTLRRDGKGPLKFSGERIGDARRSRELETDNGEPYTLEISARLFKTTGGKYVVGVEEYDKTNEEYGIRFAEAAATLQELVELIRSRVAGRIVNDDLLGELFEDTEIADQFVEQID
jgi:hypothetical protein